MLARLSCTSSSFLGLKQRSAAPLPHSPPEMSDSLVLTGDYFSSFVFKTIEELEKEMLNGQKLQGPLTSAEVYRILKQKGLLDK